MSIRFLTKKKSSSESPKLNIFTGENEPEKKDGIWLKKDINIDKIIRKDNIYIEPNYIVKYHTNNTGGTNSTRLPSWIKENGYNYLFISFPSSSTTENFLLCVSKGRITVNWNSTYFFVYGNDGFPVLSQTVSAQYGNIPSRINALTESDMSSGNLTASLQYLNNSSSIYSCNNDIYRTTGVIKYKAPEIETFENNTLILVQNNQLISIYNNGVYRSILVNSDIGEGVETYFNDVVYSDGNSNIDKTIETYYGNGTEWIKFKN